MKYISTFTRSRVTRFLIVGASNTAVNFVVLNFAFYFFNLGKLSSSIVATLTAILWSFFLNRSFVFRDKEQPAKKFILFFLLSSLGVLILQSSVFMLFVTLLEHSGGGDALIINLSNVFASIVVGFWNYYSYKTFVFTKSNERVDH